MEFIQRKTKRMHYFSKVVGLIAAFLLSISSNSQIQSMIGHVGMRNAAIWMHDSQKNKEVTLAYSSDKKHWNTTSSALSSEHSFCHTFTLSELTPNTTYFVLFQTNNNVSDTLHFTTQELWQWRKDPPAFQMAFGSCAYINDTDFDRPGKPYGKDTRIFQSIAQQHPNAMVWLGDNIYFREGDWETYQNMMNRYFHARQVPSMQTLLNACPNYAIWDDHDFGPNDCDGTFVYRKESLQAFNDVWANSNSGIPGGSTNCNTAKVQINDVDLYLIDNRSFRTPYKTSGVNAKMIGDEQLTWLIEDLKNSRATFKLICIGSQVINSVPVFETFANYTEESKKLFQLIEENEIKNIIFITGDRHFAELSERTLSNNIRVLDITTSPLTSSPYTNVKEENTYRVKGTLFENQNYCTIQFNGPVKEREAIIELHDIDGKSIWKKSFTRMN